MNVQFTMAWRMRVIAAVAVPLGVSAEGVDEMAAWKAGAVCAAGIERASDVLKSRMVPPASPVNLGFVMRFVVSNPPPPPLV